MTLINWRNHFRESLASLYQQVEIDAIFKGCLQHYFSWTAIKIGLEPQYELSLQETEQLNRALVLLSKGTPLQYVLGLTTFRGLTMKVNPAVLIPRPETEELVEWIIENHGAAAQVVWDLCSGSGCIALGLKAENEAWTITGFELSETALEVAKTNAQQNNLAVAFVQQDVLQWAEINEKATIIVANPPYVLPMEKKQMHRNVLDHEPEMALFVPEQDPLLFYREILRLAAQQLTPKGKVYFEINPLLVEEMIALGKSFAFAFAQVKKDIFGKDRFIQFSKHDD